MRQIWTTRVYAQVCIAASNKSSTTVEFSSPRFKLFFFFGISLLQPYFLNFAMGIRREHRMIYVIRSLYGAFSKCFLYIYILRQFTN